MGSWFIHGLKEIEERLYEHCVQAQESQVLGMIIDWTICMIKI